MLSPRAWLLVALPVTLLGTACDSLVGSPATEVPGAAATLTRSERTPIPTVAPHPSAGASPSPSSVRAAPSPSTAALPVSPSDGVEQVRSSIVQAVSAPEMPGLEDLLLDRVSLSSADGGEILSRGQAAQWLRDRAGAGMRLTRLDRSAMTAMVEVGTDGWPITPPIAHGGVTFDLHRYDQSGQQSEASGAWKIDVIAAE